MDPLNYRAGYATGQGGIRMRSHRLLQLDNIKSVATCQQTCCNLMKSTCLLQVVLTTCSKSANIKLHQVRFSQACCNLRNLSDLLQVCQQLASSLLISSSCSKLVEFLAVAIYIYIYALRTVVCKNYMLIDCDYIPIRLNKRNYNTTALP